MSLEQVVKCPICLSDSRSMEMLAGDRGTRIGLKCRKCGAIFKWSEYDYFYQFSDREPENRKEFLSSQEIEIYTNEHFKEAGFDIVRERILAAVKFCGPGVILDIGCGYGRFGYVLQGLYREYYGLDPSNIPRELIRSGPPPENAVLIHNDPDRPLPIHDGTVDLAAFFASYDHIPDAGAVLKELDRKLKPRGHLMIVMSNQHFWPKRLLKILIPRSRRFLAGDHFRVHDPESLACEVMTVLPGYRVVNVDADHFLIPRLPKTLSMVFFSRRAVLFENQILKLLLNKILRLKNAGSAMIVVFQKQPSN